MHINMTETVRRRTNRRNEIFKNKLNLLAGINEKLIKRTTLTETVEKV